MKIRNKRTGEIREVPDGALPTAAPNAAPIEGPSVVNNVKEGLAEIPGFLKGAANKVRETTSQPILRFLAEKGFGPAQREMEGIDSFRANHTPVPGEKAGEVAADFGMLMAPLPGGKVKAASTMGRFLAGLGRSTAMGAQGAAQHQAQNYAQTGDVDLGAAALETGAGAVLGGAGQAAAPAAKWLGVKTLSGLTRAPKRLERGMNPPTDAGFEQALENRLVPILKGGFREAEKRGMNLQMLRDAEKKTILDAAKVRGNAPAAINEAESAIRGRVTGSRGLLPTQQQQGIGQMAEYEGAWRQPGAGANRFGDMSGADFIDLRKMADQNAKFVEGKTPMGLDLASQEFRTAAEDQLLRKMQGKGGEKRYIDLKRQMAEIAPVLEAFDEKAVSNYSWAPEIGSGTITALTTQNPTAAALATAIPAIRRYPGIAPLLYETGKGVGSKPAKKTAKAAFDLSRAYLSNQDSQ